MALRRLEDDKGTGGRGGRRLDVVLVLVGLVMIGGGAALFPLSVASNKLSGLWITLCASLGLD